MKLTLTPRELRAAGLLAAVGIAVVWIYGGLILGPLCRRAVALGREVRQQRDQLARLEDATAREAELERAYQQLQQRVETMRQRLPQEAELSRIIETLSELALQAGLRLQSIAPQRTVDLSDAAFLDPRPPEASRVYQQIPIQIEALAGYHQLGAYLSLTETLNEPIQLVSLRITSHPKYPTRHSVRMILHAFVAPPAAEAPGGHAG